MACAGSELPDSIRQGQRLTGMTAGKHSFPVANRNFRFAQHGRSGAWVSELLPHTARVVDDLCFIKSMYTEAINHDPAITFFQTGSQLAGRPSIGSWVILWPGERERRSAGVRGHDLAGRQPDRSAAVRSTVGQRLLADATIRACKFRSGGDPVLYCRTRRESMPTRAAAFSTIWPSSTSAPVDESAIPRFNTRIAQYELAFRMQTAVPGTDGPLVTSRSKRSTSTDPDSRKPGTFAANCLLARRLAERGVRFIQLYHRGWDQHGDLPREIVRSMPGYGPGVGGAGHGSQTARHARRHAGRLGRRIRPHRVLPRRN